MELVRSRGRQRSRVLYVFRTPPGVKVGRDPFDADTRRLLERANPDLEFDWDALIRSLPPPETEPEARRPVRRVRRPQKAAEFEPIQPAFDAAIPEEPPGVATPPAEPASGGALSPADGAAPLSATVEEDGERPAGSRLGERAGIGARERRAGPRFPTEIEGETVGARIAWLRVWHIETVARIEQEIADEPRRTELLRVVARLDPRSWDSPEAIEAGMADATAALRELARVFDAAPDS